jgi:hypothetical protein
MQRVPFRSAVGMVWQFRSWQNDYESIARLGLAPPLSASGSGAATTPGSVSPACIAFSWPTSMEKCHGEASKEHGLPLVQS